MRTTNFEATARPDWPPPPATGTLLELPGIPKTGSTLPSLFTPPCFGLSGSLRILQSWVLRPRATTSGQDPGETPGPGGRYRQAPGAVLCPRLAPRSSPTSRCARKPARGTSSNSRLTGELSCCRAALRRPAPRPPGGWLGAFPSGLRVPVEPFKDVTEPGIIAPSPKLPNAPGLR